MRKEYDVLVGSGHMNGQLINAQFGMSWFVRSMSIGNRSLLYVVHIRRSLGTKVGLNQFFQTSILGIPSGIRGPQYKLSDCKMSPSLNKVYLECLVSILHHSSHVTTCNKNHRFCAQCARSSTPIWSRTVTCSMQFLYTLTDKNLGL